METNKLDKNTENARRRKLIITVAISFAIYVLILVTYVLISYYTGPGLKYKKKVIEYLNEKYNQDFNVKFEKERQGATYSHTSCDGSSCDYYTGPNKDVKEYVYSVSQANNKNIKTYVVYSYNSKDQSEKIYETMESPKDISICGESKHENAYGDMQTWHQEKQEVKKALEECLGNKYRIDLDSEKEKIIVKTNQQLEDVVKNHYTELETMYYQISKMLQDKTIKVEIRYVGNNGIKDIIISGNSKIEDNYTIKDILNKE